MLSAMPLKPKKRSRSESDTERGDDSALEAIAAALHRAEKRYLSKNDHHETPSGLANKLKAAIARLTTSEWLMVAFTAAIFIVGVASAFISYGQQVVMRGQQVVMQGQLDEMRDEQRAWLVPTITIDEQGFRNPLGDRNDLAPFSVIFITVKFFNIGKTPAFHVVSTTTRFDNNVGSFSQQKAVCDQMRGNLVLRKEGGTVLPNETGIETDPAHYGIGVWPPNNPAGGTIRAVGCASYEIQGSDRPHFTSYAFAVGHKSAATENPNDFSKWIFHSADVVPQHDLFVQPMPRSVAD